MNTKWGVAIACAATVALSKPTPARADGYIGIATGPSWISQDLGMHMTYGARTGWRFGPEVSAGFFGSFTSLGSGLSPSQSAQVSVAGTAKFTFLATEINFAPMSVRGAYFGAKLGLGIISHAYTSPDGTNFTRLDTTTNFAAGPTVGYAYNVTPQFVVGVEASDLMVTGLHADLNSLGLLGLVTYIF